MKVHRCRFVEYVPSTINCACFVSDKVGSKDANLNDFNEFLVVGRENGDVEIFDVKNQMTLESKLCTSVPVQGIVCPSVDLIVTAHLEGYLRLWNRVTGQMLHQTDSFGGPVWSVAKNPCDPNMIACGCDDGSVKIFEVLPTRLSYSHSSDRQDGKLLCLQWNASGDQIAACSSTGFLNIFSYPSGNNLKRISIADGQLGETYVWTLTWIGTTQSVACGDSSGCISIWNVSTGTMIQKLTTHKADILAIAHDPMYNSIFASGIDSAIVQLENAIDFKGALRNSNGELIFRNPWTVSKYFNSQSHDVKVLLSFTEGFGRNLLVAGGADAQLYVYSQAKDGLMTDEVVSHLNGKERMISFANERHLLAVAIKNFAEVWGISGAESKLFCKVYTPTGESVAEVAVSNDGSFLAVATATSTFFYHLQLSDDTLACLAIKRLTPQQEFSSLSQFRFSKDNLLYALNSIDNCICSISCSQDAVAMEKVFNSFTERVIKFTIDHSNSKIAVQLESFNVYIYSTNPAERALFKLPKPGTKCQILEFFPSKSRLFVGLSDNSFNIFDLNKKGYSDWSLRNPPDKFPIQWQDPQNRTRGIAFFPNAHDCDIFYLWSNEIICKVDLKKDFQSSNKNTHAKSLRPQSKRKRVSLNKIESYGPFSIISEFSAILGIGAMNDDSIVVVERPWAEIYQALPPAFQRKSFNK